MCPVDSALDPQGPLSQAVLRLVMEEVNREVNKAEAQQQKWCQYLSFRYAAPTEFVLSRRGSLPHKTRHWSTPSLFLSCIARLLLARVWLCVPRRNQNLHHVYWVQSSYIICENIAPRNLKPQNLILRASSSFSWKFLPMKITCYLVWCDCLLEHWAPGSIMLQSIIKLCTVDLV